MNNLIIVISILLTVLLVGCVDKGVYVGGEYIGREGLIGVTDYDGDYYGKKKDGIRHGQGTMIWTDGK